MFKRILKKVKNEPVIFLFRKMWKFAEGHRGKVVLFLLMTVVANIIILAQPLIFAEFLNEIQRNGFGEHNIKYLFLVLFSIILVQLSFWLFHGPSRIIEKNCAFKTGLNYRKYLLKNTLNFNLTWHGKKDSGDSIDKIDKAHGQLFRFSRNIYEIPGILIRIFGTTIILIFFNLYVGLLAFVILIFTFYIIFKFDKRLVPQYKKLNIFDNKISAKIFDTVSNITSVKILRIENIIFKDVRKALWTPFKLYKKNSILGETKWFTGQILFTLIIVLPFAVYIFYLYENNLAVKIGTLSALFVYLSDLRAVFFSFAGIYEDMMIQKASIQNAKEIEESFSKQNSSKKQEIKNWNFLNLKNLNFKYDNAEKKEKNIWIVLV